MKNRLMEAHRELVRGERFYSAWLIWNLLTNGFVNLFTGAGYEGELLYPEHVAVSRILDDAGVYRRRNQYQLPKE